MCMVSFVGDQYARRWDQPPYTPQTTGGIQITSGVSQADFDELKREVEALKVLLKAAKKFDEETGQPDCEQDEKVAVLKRVADLVGVDLSDVLG